MRSQRLSGESPASVPEVLLGTAALQAQSTSASRLAVRPRSTALDAAAVIGACNDERAVVRTWLMRGTLHMVAADDVGWLLGLLGPRFAARGRGRRHQLGLGEDVCERALTATRAILASSGPLTRSELVAALARSGVVIDQGGQAPAHLVMYAALSGLVCRGPERADDEPTYVLLDDWVGRRRTLDGDRALKELARRYLRAYAPAGADDLAAWAGIGLGVARSALALLGGELAEIALGAETGWMLAAEQLREDDAERPCVRLLPHFDSYLLGYRRRDLMLAPGFANRIQAGGGWIHPALVVDGWIAGAWRQARTRDRLSIVVEPFEQLQDEVVAGVEAEAADIGRFLGSDATLAVEAPGR